MTTAPTLPTVAIVGRPNVGKSTLFNRLVGERRAIVSEIAGTTRDRIRHEVTWNGRSFTLMDMGGLDEDLARQHQPERAIERQVVEQVLGGIAEADLVLFVVDGRMELTQLDLRAAEYLRRSGRPVVLVANKAEQIRDASEIAEVYQLGFGEPLLVSANHGTGTGDLLDAITSRLNSPMREQLSAVRVALVGRPNVGKSSLVNRLAGGEVSIVSDIPGTTRDAVDTDLEFQGQRVRLVDTAGIRRAGKVTEDLDIYSVTRARAAIDRSDVCVLVLPADEPVAKQDQAICARAIKAGTGLVLVANKWDIIKGEEGVADQLLRDLHRDFVFLPWVPVVFASAVTGEHVEVILEQALAAQAERTKRVDAADLTAFIKRLALASPPPPRAGKPVRLIAAAQVGVCPPSFSFTMHGADDVHFSYRRFLERSLRERYGFIGTPVRMSFTEG